MYLGIYLGNRENANFIKIEYEKHTSTLLFTLYGDLLREQRKCDVQ